MRKSRKRMLAGILSAVMAAVGFGGGQMAETHAAGGKIVVDYNTSIGTGTPGIFGGVGTPSKDQGDAWNKLADTMGVRLIKVDVDLSALFPDDADTIDTNVYENYAHVAGSIFTRIKGSNMKAMLEFQKLPLWCDADSDGMYDAGQEENYKKMIRKFLTDSKPDYEGIISHVEIAPASGLSDSAFTDMYYTTAKEIRAILPKVKLGGFGYVLADINDTLPANVKAALTQYKSEPDTSLLQYVSVRAYSAEPTDGNSNKDVFGEFKAGRKAIRKALSNQDMPLYMTGWSTSAKDAASADSKVKGAEGIKYHTSALFKSMRDGWNVVLYDSTVSDKEKPGSYTYTLDTDGNAALNPFARVYHLLGNKLGLNAGDFKVVSTDMGSSWAVDDSIAMQNSKNETIMLLTNFSTEKSNVEIELKNVPYEDGAVKLELYIASENNDSSSVFQTIDAQVQNGIITAAIPSVPQNCAMGVIVKDGTGKSLPAQSIYEFESQDNHFGGDMEIGWTNGASFNRTVKGFGGENNFITLRKVAADGDGTYTAHLYAANPNANIMVSVNGGVAEPVDGSGASLSKSADFEVSLKAGNENTIKFYTTNGELKPDRLVLEPKDVKLSIGFQNLSTLEKLADGSYVLPLSKTDFTVDARIFPEASSGGKSITFESSDTNVVGADASTGLLTPKQVGTATITAKITGITEDVHNSFDLTVKNAVSSVSVSPSVLSMKQGDTAALTAAIVPENAQNKNVTWTSSAPSLVEITEQNNSTASIRAVAETGTATVTATTEDGNKKATCTVTIVKPVPGGTIKVDYGNTISTGSPGIFGVTHYPSVNATDSDIGDHSIVWPMLTEQAGVRFMRADARLQEILPIWTKTPDTNWERPAGSIPADQPSYVKSDYYYVTAPDGSKAKFSLKGYQDDMAYFEEHGIYLNGMSNPDNWNTGRLLSWIDAANAQGYEVMAMTFQIPEWLSAGEIASGDPHTKKVCNGAPKDWAVYRDIVKKVYKLIRDKIDYYEFLNEPHWYVPTHGDQRDPDGNPYTGGNIVNNIAADQFYQAIDAIYEAEAESTGDENAKPKIKLGGGADDSWGGNYGVLGTLFSGKYAKWKDRVDFVSIHRYGDRPANGDDSNNGANSRNLKYWLREKTGRDMPLFLNEYNVSTGQPTDETYGYKSVGWHGKNLIDMMVDEYTGGGYYTCYPADVPMDDYEASSGWIERGKGMYKWSGGNPELANFTKAWGLFSVKLGLGKGPYAVKSTNIDGSMSHAIGAVNTDGNAVAFINNYSAKAYDSVKLDMKNVPYAAGTDVTASVYQMTSQTDVAEAPVTVAAKVAEDGSVTVEVPGVASWGMAGVILSGTPQQKADTAYEFESYRNTLTGTAKIEKSGSASNGRVVVNASGDKNAVTIPVEKDTPGITKLEVKYKADKDSTLTYSIGAQTKTVALPAGQTEAEIQETLETGKTEIKFYVSAGSASLDSVVRYDMDKNALKALIDKPFTEDGYTEKSWAAYQTAKTAAQKVLDNDSATAQEVSEAYEALKDAIANLEVMVNLKELVESAAENEEKIGSYTTASWISFARYLRMAQNVLADPKASQEEQIAAYRNLEKAAAELAVIETDKNKSLVEESMPTTNDPGGGKNLDKATDGAASGKDDENTFAVLEAGTETNAGPDNGYSTWNNVYLQFDLKADYTIDKINVYRAVFIGTMKWKETRVEVSSDPEFAPENTEVLAYGPELITNNVGEALQEVIPAEAIKARYVRVGGRGYQGTWGGATNAYSNKVMFSEIQVFGSYIPTKEDLDAGLDEAKKYDDEGKYTSASFEALQKAVTKAIGVSGNEKATQAEINEAAGSLMIAIDELKAKPDTQALNEQIQALEKRMGEASWALLSAGQQKGYADILAEAKALAGEEEATQEAVDAMRGKVETAAVDLAADYAEANAKEEQKQVLKDAVAQARAIDLSGFTKETVERFQEALAAVNNILNDPGSSKADYRNAYEQLQAAISALSTADPEDPNQKPDPGQKPDPEKPNPGQKPDPEKPNPGQKPDPENPDQNPNQKPGSETKPNPPHKDDAVTNGDGKNKAARTGDAAQPIAVAIEMLMSLTIGVVLIFSRRRWKI